VIIASFSVCSKQLDLIPKWRDVSDGPSGVCSRGFRCHCSHEVVVPAVLSSRDVGVGRLSTDISYFTSAGELGLHCELAVRDQLHLVIGERETRAIPAPLTHIYAIHTPVPIPSLNLAGLPLMEYL
jgi:hypothetical protein